jgi:arginyl-tRNA synthetase
VYARILEIQKSIKFDVTAGLYPGEYIKDIAKSIIKKKLIISFENYDLIKEDLGKFAMQEAMVMIKNDLLSLGIKHDLFVSETDLVNKNNVNKAIKILEDKNYIYTGVLPKPKGDENEDWEPRDQLLFKSTLFGDDVDRALKKSDDTWTYFANDVAYHLYKLDREYDQYINILGADHAGYLKRLQACVTALSDSKVNFVCKVCQLVKLYKSGEPYKMSKRAGDFITAKELVDAVGKDAVRFMMIYRSNDSQLDFDFDLVTEKSKENPVFYVQYATARINSILRKVKVDNNQITKDDLSLLNSSYELEIIKKLSVWPKCLELSAVNLEPHRIPYYLYELSSMFHSYWNLGKENNDFKIVDNPNINLVKARVFLINKILLILKSGLSILNVSAPETM